MMMKDRNSPYSGMARGDPALLLSARGDPGMFQHTGENPSRELLIFRIMTGQYCQYGKDMANDQ